MDPLCPPPITVSMDTGCKRVLEDDVRGMNSKDLAIFLSRIMDVNDHGEDIEKLMKNKINGKIFLTLPDDDSSLKELGLSVGGKVEIKSIVKSLKESSSGFMISDVSGDNVNSAEHLLPIEPNQPWCSTSTGPPSLDSTPLDTLTEDREMQSGFVPLDTVWPWKDYSVLCVQFLDPIPDCWTVGNSAQMNKENILSWANVWSQKGDGLLPRFVEAKPKEEAQIRVKFNDIGSCNSVLGKKALSVPVNEPTMNLDLHQGGHITDEFKRHLVIHEFGHALGLGHEHQRSNFWSSIKRFTDVKKMKKDLKVSDKQFEQDWGAKFNNKCGHLTEYDPHSIMHYWFKKDWLLPRYREKTDIEKARDSKKLSPEQASALLGVHERHGQVAHEPSSLDLKLLKELYGGITMPTAAPPPMPSLSHDVPSIVERRVIADDFDTTQQNATTQQNETRRLDIKDLVVVKTELWPVRTRWREIGENLGEDHETLEAIQINQRENPGACLREMLSVWLCRSSTSDNPISWAALVKALKKVDRCGHLAQKIEKKYLDGESGVA